MFISFRKIKEWVERIKKKFFLSFIIGNIARLFRCACNPILFSSQKRTLNRFSFPPLPIQFFKKIRVITLLPIIKKEYLPQKVLFFLGYYKYIGGYRMHLLNIIHRFVTPPYHLPLFGGASYI